jgi:hypothetical protein
VIAATSPLPHAARGNHCPALRRIAFAWAATSARAFFRFRIGSSPVSWYPAHRAAINPLAVSLDTLAFAYSLPPLQSEIGLSPIS